MELSNPLLRSMSFKLQVAGYKSLTFGFWLLAFSLSLTHCTTKEHKQATKFDQYYVQGEGLYLVHCSNCHQKKGTGLGLLYPPLDKSDYMDSHFQEVICLMKNGKQGELLVNGKQYNKPMKGLSTLTELEIAEIATYIYNTWDHQRGIVEVREVAESLMKCPD